METNFHKHFYNIEPKVILANLARIFEDLRESIESYGFQFKTLKTNCIVAITKQECIKLILEGM
jgi:hypothetical protein